MGVNSNELPGNQDKKGNHNILTDSKTGKTCKENQAFLRTEF